VYRSSQTSPEITRTTSDHSINRMTHKHILNPSNLPQSLLDRFNPISESIENTLDISPLLHRYDPNMISLIDPKQKLLVLTHKNSPSMRPVLMVAASRLHSVLSLKQEVVIYKLLSLLFSHGSMSVEVSFEFLGESFAYFFHQVCNLHPSLFSSSGVKGEESEITSTSDPCRNYLFLRVLF
jgi:hypothetical protein